MTLDRWQGVRRPEICGDKPRRAYSFKKRKERKRHLRQRLESAYLGYRLQSQGWPSWSLALNSELMGQMWYCADGKEPSKIFMQMEPHWRGGLLESQNCLMMSLIMMWNSR